MHIVSGDLASREIERPRGHAAAPWIGVVFALVAAVGLLVFGLDTGTRMNVKDLFVDPGAKAGYGPHVGLFSHLGVLVLWSGVTTLVGVVLLGRGGDRHRFMLSLAALLGWLAIDDLYMIHEELGGLFARFVLPAVDRRMLEGIVFAAYGVAWLLWLGRYRRTIRSGPAILLGAALVMLGGSVGVDVGEIFIEDWVNANAARNTTFVVLEELMKLGGVILLASYAVALARERVERAPDRR